MKLDPKQTQALARWRPKNHLPARLYARAIAHLSMLIMRRLNHLQMEGLEELQKYRHGRNKGRGLLTFSNHVSMLDDPLLPANFNTPDFDELRWIAADAINFWGGPIRGFLSSAGKCVPIVRGAGADQPGFRFIAERLKAGDWVHIFPEGGRTRDPNGLLRTPFKNGIGRMIIDTHPIAIPYYHYGMHEVLPIGSHIPRLGKQIRIKFGKATDCNEEFVRGLGEASDTTSLQRAIAQWSYRELRALELELNPHSQA